MTINHYYIGGVEYPEIPDPCNGVSPMHKSDGSPNVELFVSLGGESSRTPDRQGARLRCVRGTHRRPLRKNRQDYAGRISHGGTERYFVRTYRVCS